jgi:hypothetical protein
MGIPSLQERDSMLDNHGVQPRQFPCSETARAGELNWIEPILRRGVAAFDVDVRRLAIFQAVKEEAERAGS